MKVFCLHSESELLYDWWFTANQFVLAPSPLRLTARIFSQLSTCGHSPCITSSLMRGGSACHLQLLLTLASAFILGSESCRTLNHILLSQIWDFPFCHLLRLAGLRWRYLTLPPHGNISPIRLVCYNRQLDGLEDTLSNPSILYFLIQRPLAYSLSRELN
jgi:hypothetical protein